MAVSRLSHEDIQELLSAAKNYDNKVKEIAGSAAQCVKVFIDDQNDGAQSVIACAKKFQKNYNDVFQESYTQDLKFFNSLEELLDVMSKVDLNKITKGATVFKKPQEVDTTFSSL